MMSLTDRRMVAALGPRLDAAAAESSLTFGNNQSFRALFSFFRLQH
jgi:hypothetical protein